MLFSRDKERPAATLPGRDASPFPIPERHAVLGTPLQPPFPEGLEVAYFALGCFWGAERLFWGLDGVYSTAVGYAGGDTPNPTYEETCTGRTGHTETVQVVYDPARGLLRRPAEGLLGGARPDPGRPAGQRRRHPVPLGDLHDDRGAGADAERTAGRLRGGPARRRPRADHDRGRAGRPVLLRRGLPPAVPPQGAPRLLRPEGHRRHLRDRLGRRARAAAPPARAPAPPTRAGSAVSRGRASARPR